MPPREVRERSERNPEGENGELSPFCLVKSGKKKFIDNICHPRGA